MRRTCVALLALPVITHAQLGGPGQYPQFRGMSGLPGSGYGLTKEGEINPMGAWSLSSPIAYSLKPWQFVASFGALSRNLSPQFLDTTTNESNGNGSGVFSVGLPLGKYGTATYSLMVLSSRLDNAGHFTWTPPGQRGPVTFGVGVQDVSGGAGTQGEGKDGKDPGNSRSYFVVGTYQGPKGIFVSLGKGTQRFERVFGNVSANLSPRAKAVVEQDGYNWNYGFGYDLGDFAQSPRKGAKIGATLFAGVVSGKYAAWSLTFRF